MAESKFKKIFIGTHNVASQIQDWKKGFESLGMEVISAAPDYGISRVKNDVDINLSSHFTWTFRGIRPHKLQKYLAHSRLGFRHKLLNQCLEDCDIFLFIWNSIYDNYADLARIKAAGKKIIFLFVGSDVRWINAMKQDFERHGVPPIEYDENYSLSTNALEGCIRRMRMAEKYADLILSLPNQSQFALRPYHQAFAVLDTDLVRHNPVQNKRPLVVHSPSNSTVKGSKYIVPVLEKLKNELGFDVAYVEGMAYHEALELYANADILVGQLFIPTGGKQEREALAAGTVVLSSMYYDYPDKIPNDCPIVDVNPVSLESQLRKYVLDFELRQELAHRGRDYVLKYHASKVNAQMMIDLLSNEKEPDFKPDFFRNHYLPESEEVIPLYNKWTHFVKDQSWYSKHVSSGERDGLVF